MEFLTAFLLVLFCFHFDGIDSKPQTDFDQDQPQPPLNEGDEVNYLDWHYISNTTTTERATTTAASEQDSLQNISIQDLLLSGIDGNEKIQKKIINEIKHFPRYFENYGKPIILSTEGYSFPKKLIKYDMDKGYIVYRNVSVSQSYDYYDNKNFKFSINVDCDSSSTDKMRVELPTNIQISAKFSITHPRIKSTNEGEISIVIRNGTVLKLVNSTGSTKSEMSYTDSKVDIHFEGPKTLIYNKLEDFLDEIESSLHTFFAQQLNEKMEERDLSLISDCSNIRFAEPAVKKIHSPYFSYFLTNLYVIPEVKIATWNGIVLSAGPIVIDGFIFNSTQLSISRQFQPVYGTRKQLTSRIRTGNLKGKFQWNYNFDGENDDNSTSVFYFSIDNILFENSFQYRSNYGGLEQEMNVYLGKINIKPSASSCDVNEGKFAKFVLSEYLKSTITESLKKSLSERADDTQRSFVLSLFDSM